MKKKIRKGLRLVLPVVFLVSTVLMLRQQLDNRSGSEDYADAQQLAFRETVREPVEAAVPSQPPKGETVWIPAPVEDDPQMEEMARIDLAALQEVNPDVVGWIRIPDTKIDYPLLQGEDNDFYLKHTWKKEKNSVGSVFLEYRNSRELTDYNTIVYAHNMRDGSMFATLRRYTDKYYWQKHPYVYVLTEAGAWRYEVFASYKAPVDSPTYGLSFLQKTTKAEFLIHALDESRYDTDIFPEENDRILTLSTCTGSGYSSRWVVQARLKMMELKGC